MNEKLKTLVTKWYDYFNEERYLWQPVYTEYKRLQPIFCAENKCTVEYLESVVDGYWNKN